MTLCLFSSKIKRNFDFISALNYHLLECKIIVVGIYLVFLEILFCYI